MPQSPFQADEIIRTADGSNTLHSTRYGETYHSVNGAMTESCHVFLNASGAARRLQEQQPTRVLEIGFGLGLNCLLTADMARQNATQLEYHAFESNPGVLEHIARLHYDSWLKTPDLLPRLLKGIDSIHSQLALPESLPESLTTPLTEFQAEPETATNEPLGEQLCNPGCEPNNSIQNASRTQSFTIDLGGKVTLKLYFCDAVNAPVPTGKFDAIYLDAFSPDNNPECWGIEFLAKLHTHTASNGVLTTYSAKGSVRRALIAAGYSVNKMPGPPGKREMLRASR